MDEMTNTATDTMAAETPATETPAPDTAVAATDNNNPFNFPTAPTESAKTEEAPQVIGDDYQIKIADGLELQDGVRDQFISIAKECKLTPAQADKLVELHSNLMLNQLEALSARNKAWADEVTAQGLNTPTVMQNAKRTIDMFGGDAATEALIQTGAIYHPAVIGMLQKIGGLLVEDNAPEGNSGRSYSDAEMFFSNTKL